MKYGEKQAITYLDSVVLPDTDTRVGSTKVYAPLSALQKLFPCIFESALTDTNGTLENVFSGHVAYINDWLCDCELDKSA